MGSSGSPARGLDIRERSWGGEGACLEGRRECRIGPSSQGWAVGARSGIEPPMCG